MDKAYAGVNTEPESHRQRVVRPPARRVDDEDGDGMKCPACASLESRVVDSRLGKEGLVIRRRRACQTCERRFTTYERIEAWVPLVVKKDGRREPFDRVKLLTGIAKACEKRPVSLATIEALVQEIEETVGQSGEAEVPSQSIGERVMRALYAVDDVAYVRFASVYRSFRDVSEFIQEIHDLLEGKPPQERAVNGEACT